MFAGLSNVHTICEVARETNERENQTQNRTLGIFQFNVYGSNTAISAMFSAISATHYGYSGKSTKLKNAHLI